jgi:hypothetical protein
MRKRRNIIWAYFTSPLFFAVGVAAAYLLVNNFCSHPLESAEQKALKADSPVKAAPALPIPAVPVPFEKKKIPVNDSKNIFNLQPQAGRRLPSNNPPPIQDTQAVKMAADLSEQYVVDKMKSGNVRVLLSIALAVLLTAIWIKKDSVLNATETDMDPPELTLLFTEFKFRIDLFRNPRKVLRFLNLVKYHYYFLTKNDLGSIENLRKMMWILLEIQDDHEFINIDGIGPEELSHANWFYKRIQNKPWHADSGIKENDKALLMIILKLNVDMGS